MKRTAVFVFFQNVIPLLFLLSLFCSPTALAKERGREALRCERRVSVLSEEGFGRAFRLRYRVWPQGSPVTVLQKLDPRFALSQGEQARLREGGVALSKEKDGWRIVWNVGEKAGKLWTEELTVTAREDFPGGNGIPLDGETGGVCDPGRWLAAFPAETVNVPLSLPMKDAERELFLGERVSCRVGGRNVEEVLCGMRRPNWYGREPTGTFTFLWEHPDGTPIGDLKQLETLRPEEDSVYRFRASYRPFGSGEASLGTPVEETEKTARYILRIVSGTVLVRVRGKDLSPEDTLLFCLETPRGRLYREAGAEADPESGVLLLETEFSGLPYGACWLSLLDGVSPTEPPRECLLGVCRENDTVSTGRRTVSETFEVIFPPVRGTAVRSAAELYRRFLKGSA